MLWGSNLKFFGSFEGSVDDCWEGGEEKREGRESFIMGIRRYVLGLCGMYIFFLGL